MCECRTCLALLMSVSVNCQVQFGEVQNAARCPFYLYKNIKSSLMTMTLSPVAVMGVAIASGDNRGQLILVQVFRYMLDSAVAFVHRHSITLVDILKCLPTVKKT